MTFGLSVTYGLICVLYQLWYPALSWEKGMSTLHNSQPISHEKSVLIENKEGERRQKQNNYTLLITRVARVSGAQLQEYTLGPFTLNFI